MPELSREVTARDGSLLRAFTVADGRWRLVAGEVDPGFIDMLLRYEDRRFHDHGGVDALALLRAAGQAAWHGRVVSGGSTLTMQVARLLEESGTGRIAGKLRQMRVAWALERRLTKDQILRLYLHLAPYGGNVEGVRAAALTWFGKEPRRLTPAQSALLVALPQSPETRRPDRHPEAALAARDRVLARMGLEGAEPIPTARRPFPALAAHLADRVQGQTTLDAGLQARLEALSADAVRARGSLQVALLVADHRTGEVLASVGSAGYRGDARQGFNDLTRALRSPGSTLKPLVYALAFDQGLVLPDTLIEDRPASFGGYAPQNFDRMFRGEVRVREALQLSLNLPVVALTETLGPARLMGAMRRAGMEARVQGQPGLAVSLGGVGVTLEGMVQLYAAIARGGVMVPLHAQGQGTEGARVVSEGAAWQVAQILSGLAPPPGQPANRLAYKTGTSYGNRDAWAIGFDGRHVIGVWMGRADGTPVPGAFGADLAAPVLFQAFQRLKPRLDPLPPAEGRAGPLPGPLQRFRPRDAAFRPGGPELVFPPDGAEVERNGGALLVRAQGGRGPYVWLADGLPVAEGREAMLPLDAGFVTLSVVDAEGRSDRAVVRLR
ncbi:penicillin-binding protein 1C [Falsirhodobacter xinxiangensis]|uniref:penicillin-binding protein 1C n=1 Tax=Falsirhodobacter xinxiangensis TaxID=2530049 RepID=UPI0010AA172B|nr:penicillin-binding protein 1C [Rhodobacter xinxiangensis]